MKVPQYQRRVAGPQPMPDVNMSSPASPDAYGAGVGRALESAGGRLYQVAERMQAEEDATRVVEAQNNLASWERSFLNDPESGIFSRQNKDAVGIYDEAAQLYEKKIKEITGGLANDRQRMNFSHSSSASMNAKLDAIARHEATQRRSWMAATAEQAIKERISDVAANYNDEAIVSAAIQDVRSSIETMFPGMGGGFIDQATKDFVSSAQIARIDAALKADDPDLAAKIYEAHEEKIDGMKRAAVKAGIDKAQTSRFVQEESDRLYRKFGLHGEAEAMRWIREHYEGDKEDSLSRYIQARYSDERRFQAQREEQLFDATYNLVDGAGSLSKALEAIGSSGMKRRHQASLRNYAREIYAGEKLPQTSPETATRIQAHLDDRSLFEKYPTWSSFYSAFGADLSFADRNRYNEMYLKEESYRENLPQTSPAVATNIQAHLDDRNLFEKYPTWEAFYSEFGADLSFNDRNRYNEMYRQVEKSAGGPALAYKLDEAARQIMSDYRIDYGSREGATIIEESNARITDEEQKLGRQLSYTEKVGIIEDQVKVHTVAATRIQSHLDDRSLFEKYPTWTSFYAEFGADLSFNDRNRYNEMYRQVEKSAGGPALTYSLHEGTKQIMSRYKVDYGSPEGSEIVEMSNAKIADEEQKLGRQLSYTEKVKIIEDQMKTHVVREKPFYWPNEKSKGYKIPLGYEFWRPFGQYVKVENGAVWDIDGGKIGHIKGPYLYDESGKTLGKLEDSK